MQDNTSGRRERFVLSSLLIAAMAFGGVATAAAAEGDKSAAGDRQFVTKAATGGMAEVEMGKLAKEKGSSADVKQFGEKMVTDHTSANQELEKIASGKGLPLPTELDAEHKQMLDALTKKSGAEFDRAYMKDMVAGHAKMHKLLENEAANGRDADLKAFAKKTLPTVEEHHKKATEVEAKIAPK